MCSPIYLVNSIMPFIEAFVVVVNLGVGWHSYLVPHIRPASLPSWKWSQGAKDRSQCSCDLALRAPHCGFHSGLVFTYTGLR